VRKKVLRIYYEFHTGKEKGNLIKSRANFHPRVSQGEIYLSAPWQAAFGLIRLSNLMHPLGPTAHTGRAITVRRDRNR
jgi:hypothetical protein